jgi:hypothetical protein
LDSVEDYVNVNYRQPAGKRVEYTIALPVQKDSGGLVILLVMGATILVASAAMGVVFILIGFTLLF